MEDDPTPVKSGRWPTWLTATVCIAAIVGSLFLGRALMAFYGPRDTLYRELRGKVETAPGAPRQGSGGSSSPR
jgi:hypothetical protein